MVCCRAVVHLDWGVVLGLWEDSLQEKVPLISDQVEWADAPFARFRAILQASAAPFLLPMRSATLNRLAVFRPRPSHCLTWADELHVQVLAPAVAAGQQAPQCCQLPEKESVCVQPQAGMMFLPPVLRAAVVVHVRRTWFQMIRLPIRWVRLSFLPCFMDTCTSA